MSVHNIRIIIIFSISKEFSILVSIILIRFNRILFRFLLYF